MVKPVCVRNVLGVSSATITPGTTMGASAKAVETAVKGNKKSSYTIPKTRPAASLGLNTKRPTVGEENVGPAYGKPKLGYTGDRVVKGKKGYDEYMAQAKKRKKVNEKMSAYDRINNRFKKLSGGQSLEDRSKYWQKEKEKTQAKLDAFRKEHGTQNEGMGAAYMPDAKDKKTPAREITSKAVLKQLNRNRNRGAMKGKVRTPNVRYVHDRQRETDLTAAQRGKTAINPEEKKKGKGHRKKKGKKSKK